MKANIVESVVGLFGVDEKKRIIGKVLLPQDPKQAADILNEIQNGKITNEMRTLLEDLIKKGYDLITFEDEELSRAVYDRFKVETGTEKPSKVARDIRSNLGKIAVELGIVKKEDDIHELTHEVSVELARIRIKTMMQRRDLLAIQTVQAIDDLDKTINLFSNRIREWYGTHFPELDRLVEKNETYFRLINTLGDKGNFITEDLSEMSISPRRAEEISSAAARSIGAEFDERDLSEIQALCDEALKLVHVREKLDKYLDDVMEEVAPNIRELTGSALGARLISIVGGLQNLARKSSSTIQVLGAEKALFRFLRTGAKPPKHGIIFQHQAIHQASKWHRGKIARALAGKIAIAARADAYTGERIGAKLKADLEERIKEIRSQSFKPPERRKEKWKK